MNATKKLALAIILLVAASAFTITTLVKEKKTAAAGSSQDAALVLYYGNGCPHCQIVEDYIAQNNLARKLDIVEKEVWQNQENQNEMAEKAGICGLDADNLGVPMLWDAKNRKCHEGDQPIVDFLKSQTGQTNH